MLPRKQSQIRDSLAHSCITDRERGSEEALPSFSECKGDGGRFVPPDLQDVNVGVGGRSSEGTFLSFSGCKETVGNLYFQTYKILLM